MDREEVEALQKEAIESGLPSLFIEDIGRPSLFEECSEDEKLWLIHIVRESAQRLLNVGFPNAVIHIVKGDEKLIVRLVFGDETHMRGETVSITNMPWKWRKGREIGINLAVSKLVGMCAFFTMCEELEVKKQMQVVDNAERKKERKKAHQMH